MFGLYAVELTGTRQLLEQSTHTKQSMPDERTGKFILTMPEEG